MAIAAVVVLMVGVYAVVTLSDTDGDCDSTSTTSDDGEELVDYSEYDEDSDAESAGFTVTYDSGTADCYAVTYNTQTKEYTLTFNEISEDTKYTVSSTSTVSGNIVINSGSTYDFELDLNGLSLESSYQPPIAFTTAHNSTLSASEGTTNTITDSRSAVTDDTIISSAVYCKNDLQVEGKGTLNVASTYNNGIHAKDKLEVKNLTLEVSCANNALKGN